ncbi:MAG: 4'-phosphopantetheinyl transferase superfamily protein [Phycisphaerales bacterium]
MMEPLTKSVTNLRLDIPKNEGVRIWFARADENWASTFQGVLTAEEHEDIQRLARESDRFDAVLSRGLWRHAAARIMGAEPRLVEVERTPYGRPLPAGIPRTASDLSTSHSSGLVALAVGSGVRVGVDVEHMYSLNDSEGVAQAIEGIVGPAVEQIPDSTERQMMCWCMFEALLKADGRGLHLSPSMVSAEIRSLWGWNMARVAGTVWWVRRLRVPTGYAGAIAAMAPTEELDLVTLDDPGLAV